MIKQALLAALLASAAVSARVGAYPAAPTSTLAAVAAPQLGSPPDGTQLQTMAAVELAWTLPAQATQYQIQLTPFDNDGPGINLIRDAAAAYRIAPPVLGEGPYVLLPSMTYTWRIRATDALTSVAEDDPAWGAWSPGWRFATPAATAATITPIEPPLGGSTLSLTPRLRWSDTNAFIFYYEVQLSLDSAFNSDPATAITAVYGNLIHGGQAQPLNSWTVPADFPLAPEARYYWRVRPRVQGDGVPPAWGDPFTFTTSAFSAGPTRTPTPAGLTPTATTTATAILTPPPPPPTATSTLIPSSGGSSGSGPTSTPSSTPTTTTPSATASPPAAAGCNWGGAWDTNVGQLVLTQSGTTLSGTIDASGQLSGAVDGQNANGTWTKAGSSGQFAFVGVAACNAFSGTWIVSGTPAVLQGVFGRRTGPAPTPATGTPAATATATGTPAPTAVCSWTGLWDAGTTLGNLALIQSGTTVNGTFPGSGALVGTVVDTTLTGSWSLAPSTGVFTFTIDSTCNAFSGNWIQQGSVDLKLVIGRRLFS